MEYLLKKLSFLSILILIITIPHYARADCADPVGKAGLMDYFSVDSTYKFCNGTDWIPMDGGSSPLWTAGTGDDIYFNSGTGNVGIGTTTSKYNTWAYKGLTVAHNVPDQAATIEIVGNNPAGGAETVGALTFHNTNSTEASKRIAQIGATRDGDDDAGQLQFVVFDSSATIHTPLTIKSDTSVCLNGDCRTTWPTGSGAGAFTDTGSLAYYTGGNVGIGTTSPLMTLDVNSGGASGIAIQRSTQTAEWALLRYYTGGVQDWMLGTRSNTDNFSISHGSSDKFVISSDGNVGIGTTAPNELLELSKSTPGAGPNIGLNNTMAAANQSSAVRFKKNGTILWGLINDYTGTGAQNFSIYDYLSSTPRLLVDGSGNVGIGTTGPTAPLQIVDGTAANVLVVNATATTNPGTAIYATTATAGYAAVNGFNSGNGGTGLLGWSGWGIYCVSGGPGCGGNAAWTNTSDARLKTDIHPITGALDKVLKLEGVYYHWRDAKRDEKEGEKIGLIAQHVEKVFPQAITVEKHPDNLSKDLKIGDSLPGGTKMLAYTDLIGPIVQAIREFYDKWQADHEELQNLANKLAALESKTEVLKADNDNLRAANDNIRARLDALEGVRKARP